MYSPLTKAGMISNQKRSKEAKDKPKLARLSAQTLPSLYMWEAQKFKPWMIPIQLSHLFFKPQGTIDLDLKAWITNWESDSNQIFVKPFEAANSIVVMAADSSANRALP